jgi:hypothetical protein
MSLYSLASKCCRVVRNKLALNYMIDRGQRALASYLGGGDLDGDDFNLILDVSSNPVIYTMLELAAAETPSDKSLRSRRIPGTHHRNEGNGVYHLRYSGLRNELCEPHSDFQIATR